MQYEIVKNPPEPPPGPVRGIAAALKALLPGDALKTDATHQSQVDAAIARAKKATGHNLAPRKIDGFIWIYYLKD